MFEWKKYRFSENGQVPPFSCDATQLIKGFRRSPGMPANRIWLFAGIFYKEG